MSHKATRSQQWSFNNKLFKTLRRINGEKLVYIFTVIPLVMNFYDFKNIIDHGLAIQSQLPQNTAIQKFHSDTWNFTFNVIFVWNINTSGVSNKI